MTHRVSLKIVTVSAKHAGTVVEVVKMPVLGGGDSVSGGKLGTNVHNAALILEPNYLLRGTSKPANAASELAHVRAGAARAAAKETRHIRKLG